VKIENDYDRKRDHVRKDGSALYASSSSDQLQHQHDDCDYQQNMDEVSYLSSGEPKTERPQNQKNDNNCPKHSFSFSVTNNVMVDEAVSEKCNTAYNEASVSGLASPR